MTKKDNKNKVVNQLIINTYSNGHFTFDFRKGSFDDGDLLYIAKLLNHDVDLSIRRGDKDN